MDAYKFILVFVYVTFISRKVCSKSEHVAYKSKLDNQFTVHNLSHGVHKNKTRNIERCFLCTRELVDKHDWVKKGLVRKASDCYPGGNYHDFHDGAGWIISLLLPNTSLGHCYIDLFAPKDDVFSNEEMKQIDRIDISRNCSNKCGSRNNHFEDVFLSKTLKNTYVLKFANKSGNDRIRNEIEDVL